MWARGINFAKKYLGKASWRSDSSEDLKWMRGSPKSEARVCPTEEAEKAEALLQGEPGALLSWLSSWGRVVQKEERSYFNESIPSLTGEFG